MSRTLLSPSCAGPVVLLVTGQSSFTARAANVFDVAADHGVAPVPFATPGLLGVAQTSYGALPLLDIDARGRALAGGLLVVVGSQVGRVCVRVDRVHTVDPSDARCDGARPLDSVLQELTSGWTPAPGGNALPFNVPVGKPKAFLRVRSGDALVAIPALSVLKVGRHSGARVARALGAGSKVVELDGELIPARSLATMLDAAQAEDEPWCLYVTAEAGPLGLLVGEILGISEFPPQAIRTLHHDDAVSTWLLQRDDAPLEVVDFGAGVLSSGEGSEGSSVPTDAGSLKTAPHGRAGRLSDLDPLPTGRTGAASDAILLHAAGWRLALPASMIDEIIGRIEPLSLIQTRKPHSLPVLDLQRLLSSAMDAPPSERCWAIKVRVSQTALVLLADFIEPAPSHIVWTPIPALPAELASLVQALHVDGAHCRMLCTPELGKRKRSESFNRLMRAAFAGWLGPNQPH